MNSLATLPDAELTFLSELSTFAIFTSVLLLLLYYALIQSHFIFEITT